MLKYLPYYELDGVPNVIVDGTPHKDSKLVLSHWIDSGTPSEWMRDTSAEIVLDYIQHQGLPTNVNVASNDHYDQDGLVGLFALIDPEHAQKNRDLLVEIATAGDFGKFTDRNAARISMALNSFVKPESSKFSDDVFKSSYPQMAAQFYQRSLKELPLMIAQISNYEALWRQEDEFLTLSESLIKNGEVKIEDDIENDIAIVYLPENLQQAKFHRFAVNKMGVLHDMAIHNATQRGRILYVQGRQIHFKYRYETWVQLKGNLHPLRVDLTGLANKLSEVDSFEWTFSGSDKLVPELKTKNGQASTLSFSRFYDLLVAELGNQPVNWNPYREVINH